MKTATRVPFLLSALAVALVWMSASSAFAQGGPGIHLTPNGFRTPIYGVSEVVDGSGKVGAECATLTAPQVEAARFDRRISRAMMVSSPRSVVSQEGGSAFDITYTDAEGAGFNDPVNGGVRRAAFEAAVSAWSKVIQAEQPIKIAATMREMDDGDNNPLTTLLAIGGPTEYWIVEDKAVPSALALQIFKGRQPNGKDIDITIDVNEKANWDYATNGVAATGKQSFVRNVLHELAHGLGMVGSFDHQTGKVLNDPYAFIYDTFVNRGSGQRNRLLDHAPDEAIGDLKSNDVFFNGESASEVSRTAAKPFPMAKLYAPNPYQPASSIGHVDQDTYADDKTGLMVARTFGQGTDKIDALTLAIIKDLGYTLVPPPPAPQEQ
jgi:hypothetical protein